jgi:hypothetical protein
MSGIRAEIATAIQGPGAAMFLGDGRRIIRWNRRLGWQPLCRGANNTLPPEAMGSQFI